MTLVEVMVAGALLGGLALAGMTLTKTQVTGQKTVEKNYEQTAILQGIRGLLADPENCAQSLSGRSVIAWSSTPPFSLQKKMPDLTFANVYTVNALQPGGVVITGYQLDRSAATIAMASLAPNETILWISFSRGDNVLRDIDRKQIKLTFTANASNQILTCHAMNINNDNLWELHSNLQDIFRLGGRVGIGTANPKQRLHVNQGVIWNTVYNSLGAHHPSILFKHAAGTEASPLSTPLNRWMGSIDFSPYIQPYSGSIPGHLGNRGSRISSKSTQAWTLTTGGSNIEFWTNPNGRTSRIKKMELEQNGKLKLGNDIGSLPNARHSIHIRDNTATDASILVHNIINSSGVSSRLILSKTGGTSAVPTAVPAGATLGRLWFNGSYTGTSFGHYGGASVLGVASSVGPWSASNQGAHLAFNTTEDSRTVAEERMRINGNGNVGIGTIPANDVKLHLLDDGNARQVHLELRENTQSNWIVPKFATIRHSGTMASPGAIGSNVMLGSYSFGGGYGGGNSMTAGAMSATTTGAWSLNNYPLQLEFWTATTSTSTKRMIIDSAGKIVVPNVNGGIISMNRHNTPVAGSHLGSITFDGSFQGRGRPAALISAYATDNWAIANGGSELRFEVSPNGSWLTYNVMTIGQTRTVGIGTTPSATHHLNVGGSVQASGFFYSSDRRLKSSVQPIANGLETILRLNGVTFDWKKPANGSAKEDIGFIAQDVEKVEPRLVATDDKGFKSLKYANIVAIVVEAIKELRSLIGENTSEIDVLRRELKELRQQNEALRQRLDAKESEKALVP